MMKFLQSQIKTLAGSFFFLALLLTSLNLSAQNLDEGLILHYTFESAPDGVVPDVSGNGNDGTLMETASVGVADDGRNALMLDGNSGYVSIIPEFANQFLGAEGFSISFWIYTEVDQLNEHVIDFANTTDHIIFLSPRDHASSGGPRFTVHSGDDGWPAVGRTEVMNTYQWYHLTVTIDGNVGKLYLNGQIGNTNNNMATTPATMNQTPTELWIARSHWGGDPYLQGMLSDFRIYNRALTEDEVLALGSDPELVTQQSALDLGDLSNVSSDITLPEMMGTDVTVSWTSSDTSYIDTTGHVLRYPEMYPIPVILTASLERDVNGLTYQMEKKFTAYLGATNPGQDLVAEWDFSRDNLGDDGVSIDDISGNGFVGSLENEAWVRTIGETTQYDVLDMGEGTGYFDMSAALGEHIHQLGEYTISLFFRVSEDYTGIGNNGNFFWSFCNTEDIYNGGGAMYWMGRNMEFAIMKTDYNTQQSTGGKGTAPQGEWHHIAYVQEGGNGTLYLDGDVLSDVSITYFPYSVIARDSADGVAINGTPYNWLGRSPYPSDAYLQNTAMYDFRLYSIPLSQDEIKLSNPFGIGLDVLTVIDDLNTAWDENNNAGYPVELNTEKDALTLGDLSAVTSNISLPSTGSIDNSITITWSISPALITTTGVVTRPDYLDTDVKLTATLSKNGYRTDTTFIATVLANEATKYTSDLLVHFNFSPENVEGNFVTDLSEKHFKGELLRGACIDTVRGVMDNYGLLKLSGDSSYFDMGDDIGKVIYGLKDGFSISVYYYINASKTNITSNGNFLYAFSNSDSSASYRNGYIFGRASYDTYAISPKRWDDGQVGTAGTANATTLGEWHHYAYVQDDTLGYVYLDGVAIDTATIKLLPNATLPKSGMIGTSYNFLGRSNFEGDVYLAGAKMYDFQIFNKKLSPSDVENMAALSAQDGDLTVGYLLADADGYINRYSPVPTGDAVQYVYKGSTLDSLVVKGDSVALLTENVRFKWYSSSNGVDSLDMNEEIVPNTVYYASQVINNYEGTERLPVLVKTKWYTAIDRKVTAGDDLRIDTSKPGLIRILDLKGDENVHVYNLVGRQISVKNTESISVDRGIYIVKVNSQIKKVFVK
ncbi:LamG-like jellyroll fold domain-containing protein [Saccharicrinis sp. FJH62]|uniref:LamG-like jellyroll fold domain-containing protein n=1 Tax=Saccharicrinis sp. FJH62 TaxID=3344657 RepID=UPI0035D50738